MGSDRHWEEMNAQPALLAAARAEAEDLKVRLADAQQQASAMQQRAEELTAENASINAVLRSIRDALPMIGADPEVARAVREEIEGALAWKAAPSC